MADGFIVRKGGVAVDLTAAPSLTLISKTDTEIVFTITNNDTETVDIFWEVDDTTPDANTLSIAGGATSSNQTASGLTQNTQFVIHAFANAAGKAGSQTVTLTVTTDAIIYTAATGGTTAEYDDGGTRYKSHTFTSDGTFTVTTVGNGDRNQVDFLIIAGGGGGGMEPGNNNQPGGGGAGGFRTTFGTQGGLGILDSKETVSATSYSILVGAGGVGGIGGTRISLSGSNSSAFGISSDGGGSGVTVNVASSAWVSAESGGSGGGGGGGDANGAAGTTNQGFAGGTSPSSSNGSGGGGAGSVGTSNTGNQTNVAGGDGLSSIIRSGSGVTYSVGGRGGNVGTRSDEAANTGKGGDAGGSTGATGGSGIVVIRYEIAPSA